MIEKDILVIYPETISTQVALYKSAAWLIPHCFPGPFPEFVRPIITKADPHAGFFSLAHKVIESISRECQSAASHQTAFEEFPAIDMILSAHGISFSQFLSKLHL